MGRSGYTSLSIEEKEYAKLRRMFDSNVSTDKTFTVWALSIMQAAVKREGKLEEIFPNLRYVGATSSGVIIQDKNDIIEISVTKQGMICKVDKGICKHVLFTCLHPEFVL